MIRAILLSGILAGAIAGGVAFALQTVKVTPLILAAEAFEQAGDAAPRGPGPAPGAEARARGILSAPVRAAVAEMARNPGRAGLSLLADMLAGAGFGLLLAAGMTLAGSRPGWRTGLVWGAAGFASFAMAPALGLPPEPPGGTPADVADRQLWWLGTAAATAGGLALVVFARGTLFRIAGLVLIALPHLIGAPGPPPDAPVASGEGLAPLWISAYGAAVLVVSGVFWLVLGAAVGAFFRHFGGRGGGTGGAGAVNPNAND